MVDQYIKKYSRRRDKPRVIFLSKWRAGAPRGQSWVCAYNTWAVIAAVPFPNNGLAVRDALEQIIRFYEPDLIHLGPTYWGDKFLRYGFLQRIKKERPSCKIVFRQGENTIGRVAPKLAPIVDMIYVCAANFVRELQKITGCTNVKFMPAGVDPEMDYPVDVEKQIDLLFLGNHGGSKQGRSDVLLKLNEDFDDLWVGGPGWRGTKMRHPFHGAYNGDFKEWNSRARIGLCLVPDKHAKLEMYYPARLVQTMATRTFALATYTPRLEGLFTRKVHLDWYTNYEELVELIRYWLEHDEERRQVAQRGYEHVLKNFTLKQYAGQVLKDVGLI